MRHSGLSDFRAYGYLNRTFRKHLAILLGVLLLILLIPADYSGQAAAATCAALSTNEGAASTTFTVTTAGDYRLWAHIYSSSSGGSALGLSIDKSCPITLDSGKLTAHSFNWIDTAKTANSLITVDLTAGTHTVTIAGQDPDVGVDKLLFLTSSACTPVTNGDNCTTITSGSPPAGQLPVQTHTVPKQQTLSLPN